VIVVDASALIAIADDEPERTQLLATLQTDERVVGSVNYVEAGLIIIGRRRHLNKSDFDHWLGQLDVTVRSTDDLASLALEAYLVWGRSYHRARLNLGDCYAYALAKQLDAPLLHKRNDFALTDVRSALQPT
jgi:ribonuclease VapC